MTESMTSVFYIINEYIKKDNSTKQPTPGILKKDPHKMHSRNYIARGKQDESTGLHLEE